MAGDELRERVRWEREHVRAWSLRETEAHARAGGEPISGQTWSVYEKGGPLTRKVRRGVAAAFGWGTDWPENPPATPITLPRPGEPTLGELDRKLDVMLEHLGRMGDALEQLSSPAHEGDIRPDPARAPTARTSRRTKAQPTRRSAP